MFRVWNETLKILRLCSSPLISLVVMPAAAAAKVLALFLEWVFNISAFTPAFHSRVISHLHVATCMVAELTGLCALVTFKNNEVWLPIINAWCACARELL